MTSLPPLALREGVGGRVKYQADQELLHVALVNNRLGGEYM
jgi:hypothetical protein